MNAPFERRYLSAEVIIPAGLKRTNAATGNTEAAPGAGQRISLQGYRIAATIETVGNLSGSAAEIQIYDLPMDLMKSLSGWGTNGLFSWLGSATDSHSTIEVHLYCSRDTFDTASGFSGNRSSNRQQISDAKAAEQMRTLIFKGNLLLSTAIMNALPDPFLSIACNGLGIARTVPSLSISIEGDVKCSVVAQQIADRIGWRLENGGVDTILHNPHVYGSTTEQMMQLAEQAGFDWCIDGGVYAIYPRGKHRKLIGGKAVPVNASNGLIAYPDFDGVGVNIRTLYRPDIRFGDQIDLQTEMPNASGLYNVNQIAHHLSSEMPGGPWETTLHATFLPNPTGLAAQVTNAR